MSLLHSATFLNHFYFNQEMIPPPVNLEEAVKYSKRAAEVLEEMAKNHPHALMDFEYALQDDNFKEAVDEYLGWLGFRNISQRNKIPWLPEAQKRFKYYIKSNPRVLEMLNDMANEIYRPYDEAGIGRTFH